MTTELGKPPCGTCTKCCTGFQTVALTDEDDPAQYEVMLAGDVLLLAFKENGDCVYLGENGCTIHGRAPRVCREFDCRGFFLMSTRNERRQMMRDGNTSRELYARGRELLPTLDATIRNQIANNRRELSSLVLHRSRQIGKAMGKNKDGKVANIVLGKPT